MSLAVPAAAAETETAAEDLQTLADTAASYAAQYGGAQSLQYALWQDGEIVLTGQPNRSSTDYIPMNKVLLLSFSYSYIL